MPNKKGNILASDEVNIIQELMPDIEKKSINPDIIFIHDSNCDIFQPPFFAAFSCLFYDSDCEPGPVMPTDFIGTTWWHRPCSAW